MVIRYTRDDVVLTVSSAPGDQVELRIEHDGAEYVSVTPESMVLNHPEFAFKYWPPMRDAACHASGGDIALNRVAIRTTEPRWAGVDWEKVLLGVDTKWSPLAVRVSDVRPRCADKMFDVPARVLEVGVPAVVKMAVAATVPDGHADFALTVGSTTFDDMQTF